MKRKIWLFLKIFLTVLVLGTLIVRIGWHEIFASLASFQLRWIFLIGALILTQVLVGAFNVYILVRYGLRSSLPFEAFFDAFLNSWCLSLLTPGKLSDVGLAYFLSHKGLPFGKGAAVLLLDNIITILVLSLASAAGLWYFFGFDNVLLLISLLAFIFLSLFMLLSSSVRPFLKKLLGKWAAHFQGFSKSLDELLKRGFFFLLLNFLITVLKWLLIFFNFYFGFKALGYAVPYSAILLVAPLARLISMVPITINGLGIREVVAVYLFGKFEISSIVVISTYLSLLILNYVFAAVFLLLHFLFFPKRRSERI